MKRNTNRDAQGWFNRFNPIISRIPENQRCINCLHYDRRITRRLCELGEFVSGAYDGCLVFKKKETAE